MDDLHSFVEKIHDTQEKAEQNKKHQGKGNPGNKLPNKRKGTGK